MEHGRKEAGHRPAAERVKDSKEFTEPLSPEALQEQAARCMDCGIPFCHGCGCPLGNLIPEVNDLAYRGRWKEALAVLESTNNFPEITGRLCPAVCEASCTLSINDEAVTIRQIELAGGGRGWREGWIQPRRAEHRTGRRVAVVGSGPAGLVTAQELARRGHDVTVYEKDPKAGGLLRYGIPDFKLDKGILDRRLAQMEAEGVRFETGVEVGRDVTMKEMLKRFHVVCLALGAAEPRDLEVEGRELGNVHYAVDYLAQQNRVNANEEMGEERIDARDKVVVVIGGGDTGSDCVGTARRQGAREVHQLEILPKPPEKRPEETPWPTWPNILRTSSSHEEGCERQWSVLTKALVGKAGRVSEVAGCRVEWTRDEGSWKMKEAPGTEFRMRAELVLLAMGFVHVRHEGLVKGAGVKVDARGNVVTDGDYQTSIARVYCVGDASRGASLVVHAMNSGRQAAAAIDRGLRAERSLRK